MTDLVRRESEFLLYTARDGAAWLTQNTIAELFGVGMPDPLAEASRPLLPPELLAHRDFIYRTHLELPVRV